MKESFDQKILVILLIFLVISTISLLYLSRELTYRSSAAMTKPILPPIDVNINIGNNDLDFPDINTSVAGLPSLNINIPLPGAQNLPVAGLFSPQTAKKGLEIVTKFLGLVVGAVGDKPQQTISDPKPETVTDPEPVSNPETEASNNDVYLPVVTKAVPTVKPKSCWSGCSDMCDEKEVANPNFSKCYGYCSDGCSHRDEDNCVSWCSRSCDENENWYPSYNKCYDNCVWGCSN
jgi:hypothetical protein